MSVCCRLALGIPQARQLEDHPYQPARSVSERSQVGLLREVKCRWPFGGDERREKPLLPPRLLGEEEQGSLHWLCSGTTSSSWRSVLAKDTPSILMGWMAREIWGLPVLCRGACTLSLGEIERRRETMEGFHFMPCSSTSQLHSERDMTHSSISSHSINKPSMSVCLMPLCSTLR